MEEIKEEDLNNLKKLEKVLDNIKTGDNKYYFLVPEIETPTSSVYEIYRHANVMKNSGKNVCLLTEDISFTKPSWIDKSLLDIEHKHISNEIKVSPQDVIVIPEIFTNVMEKIKVLQCHKILLFQSFDYALHSLLPGVDYYMWGIFDVIVPSVATKNLFEKFFGNDYNVKDYKIGIPEYFAPDQRLKKPVISYVSRNGIDINRIVKLFYLKFPYFKFLTFQDLNNLDRKSFAEKLKDSFALLWVDNISTASTVPLEAMKANTVVVGMLPNITHDYITNDNGYWTDNKYDLPLMIGKALSEYLEDEIDEKMIKNMKKTVSKYSETNSEKEILKIYNDFTTDRITTYENYISEYKNLEK